MASPPVGQDAVPASVSGHDSPPFPLADLPDDCLAAVLAHCRPMDLGRFACVCRNWRAAAQSEQAWPLISRWRGAFGTHFAALRDPRPPSQVFQEVSARGITSDDSRFFLRCDAASTALILEVSVVKNCSVVWLNAEGGRQETPYWAIREGVPGSRFPVCAYLKTVCWLQIGGDVSPPFRMPAGRYTVSWSVAKTRPEFQWTQDPAICTVALPGESKAIDGVAIDFRHSGRPREGGSPAAQGQCEVPRPGFFSFVAREGGGLAPASAARRSEGNLTRPGTRAAQRWPFPRLLQRILGGQHAVQGEEEDEFWDASEEEEGEEEENEPQSASDGEAEEGVLTSLPQSAPPRALPWKLFDAGEVELEEDENGLARLEARLDLRETTSGWWKSGMYFDSIVFTPC